MTQTVKPNKNSASEETIGLIHNLVAQVLLAKLQHWTKLMAAGGDPDLVVDMKALGNAMKFIQINGIVAADPAEQTTSALAKELEEIRKKQSGNLKLVGNGVPFVADEEEEY